MYFSKTSFLIGTLTVYSHTFVVVVLDSNISSRVDSASSTHRSGRVLKSDTAIDQSIIAFSFELAYLHPLKPDIEIKAFAGCCFMSEPKSGCCHPPNLFRSANAASSSDLPCAESVTPFLLANMRSAVKDDIEETWFKLPGVTPPASIVHRYASFAAATAPASRALVPKYFIAVSYT